MEELKGSLEHMMKGLSGGRYNLVKLSLDWLGVLKTTDEAKTLSPSELIKKALDDVATGRIGSDDIRKAKSKAGKELGENKENKKDEKERK